MRQKRGLGSPKMIKRNELIALGAALMLALIFFLFGQVAIHLLILQEKGPPPLGLFQELQKERKKVMEKKRRKRYKQFILRTTEEEATLIRRKISEAHLKTFQAFALKMLLEGEVVTVDYSELLALRKEVNAIGQNVNQIARFVNTLGEVDQDLLSALQEEISELSRLVQTEFDEGRLGTRHGSN